MIATHGCVRRSRRAWLAAALAVASLTAGHPARADQMSTGGVPSMDVPPMPMASAPDTSAPTAPGMGSQDPWQMVRMLMAEFRQLDPHGWNPGTGSGATSTMMPGAGAMPSVADWSKDHPCGCTPPPPPPTCSCANMTGTPGAATATGSPAPAASTVGQPTPAPEPSTIVSALAMLGLVAWARRARG